MKCWTCGDVRPAKVPLLQDHDDDDDYDGDDDDGSINNGVDRCAAENRKSVALGIIYRDLMELISLCLGCET